MLVIKARNVNGMLTQGMKLLADVGDFSDSRAGKVLVAPGPVTSVYQHPTERVLFSARRDANPFFHLFESLWMLSGSNDAGPLNLYVKDFGSRFSENGIIHGAYGHRWRKAFGFDQLDEVVRRLRADRNDRQCVIQMWDTMPEHEATQNDSIYSANGEPIIVGSDDLRGNWKDRPCNTHVYLRVRRKHEIRGGDLTYDEYLDLTVCCRSNDIVWGAYGANAVHFSILQEYLAGRIGVDVGTMYQVSNNYHAYVDVLDKLGSPNQLIEEYHRFFGDNYDEKFTPVPIGDRWEDWDMDLEEFMGWHDLLAGGTYRPLETSNQWFDAVAAPMAICHALWRSGEREEAMRRTSNIAASDWRFVAREWMLRRMRNDAATAEIRAR